MSLSNDLSELKTSFELILVGDCRIRALLHRIVVVAPLLCVLLVLALYMCNGVDYHLQAQLLFMTVAVLCLL